MQTRAVAVKNALGLHARACARVVQIASTFRSSVWLAFDGRRASARNIVAVMMLAASVGSTVTIEAEGPDEAAAMQALVSLFDEGFGERR